MSVTLASGSVTATSLVPRNVCLNHTEAIFASALQVRQSRGYGLPFVEEETEAQRGCVRGSGASRRGALEAGVRCLLSPKAEASALAPELSHCLAFFPEPHPSPAA